LGAFLVAGCDDDNSAGQENDEQSATLGAEPLGCGLVDEDLVVDIIGADTTSDGRGVLPPSEGQLSVTRCDVTSVTDPTPT
jgi:hypothetical protein